MSGKVALFFFVLPTASEATAACKNTIHAKNIPSLSRSRLTVRPIAFKPAAYDKSIVLMLSRRAYFEDAVSRCGASEGQVRWETSPEPDGGDKRYSMESEKSEVLEWAISSALNESMEESGRGEGVHGQLVEDRREGASGTAHTSRASRALTSRPTAVPANNIPSGAAPISSSRRTSRAVPGTFLAILDLSWMSYCATNSSSDLILTPELPGHFSRNIGELISPSSLADLF